MKFSEKLQSLRKENKLSQEQLADMLDVSRQSVSKWESGQTYPEMDKLIAMCKIFKCSLDELTNDEIKEVNSSTKTKNNFSNLIDELLGLINRSFSVFKNMKSKDIASVVFEMIILFILLAIMEKPFNYIDNLGYNVFVNFGTVLGDILSSIFHFIIMASYAILSVVIFVYIYKIRVLDKYENKNIEKNETEENISETDNSIKESKKEKEDRPYIPNSRSSDSHIFHVLGNIVMVFIKFICFWMSVPFLFSLLFLSMALVIMIILIFSGVLYFGALLTLLFCVVLNILVVELIFDFMFNKKIAVKRMFLTFIAGIVGLGMSCGILAYEISDTTYINKVPEYKETVATREYSMTNDLIINGYGDGIEYVVDNSINNIKVEATYNNKYVKPVFDQDSDTSISLYTNSLEEISADNMISLVVKNLRDKKIYNYWELYDVKFKVYASEKNINKIKENINNSYNEQEEESNYYDNQINEYQNTIDELQETNSELTQKNEELTSKIDEVNQKLSEYKDRVRELLNE